MNIEEVGSVQRSRWGGLLGSCHGSWWLVKDELAVGFLDMIQ